MTTRTVREIVESVPASDGAGVKLRRSFTPAPSEVGTDSITCLNVRVAMAFYSSSSTGFSSVSFMPMRMP